MKMKATSLLVVVLASALSFAQDKVGVVHATEIPVVFHGETVPFGEYVEPANANNEITKLEKLGVHEKNWPLHEKVRPHNFPNGIDPVLQTEYAKPAPTDKALDYNWNGIGYTGVNPADPTLAVGPNHVVQMINGGSGAVMRIYDKTGTAIGTQQNFDNFMNSASQNVNNQNWSGAGDPIALYDERADRWVLTEFSSQGPNDLYIAVSTSPDPAGTYYTYTVHSPGGFPDYPKYGIWENEYIAGANVGSSDIFALNRADLLAGTNTSAQLFTHSNFGTIGFQISTPVNLNGTTIPPGNQPAMFMRMRDDQWNGSNSDALEIWELNIDWSNSANSTFQQVETLATAAHETELCGYTSFSCIPQPSGQNALDPLREILMNNIQYRNFGTHESIVCAHVTDVDGNDHAGIRWYELRRTGGTSGSWAIYQQGTYAPDSDHRWMPSIGIDAYGNIGVAYSVSSGSTFPSLRYTGRKECDPLGVMTEPETNIVTGTASNGSNRWGDYFDLGCDPADGRTFYFTGVYNPASQWQTRIAAFKMDICSYDPTVSFNSNNYTVNEADASIAASTCLDYLDLIVPLTIAQAPSQAADVTVTVDGGTAAEGVDFDLLNASLTLQDGALTGEATIRVYNDEYVEGTETIILGYTLNANGGDATNGAFNQSTTITINDDDVALNTLVQSTQIFSYDFEAGLGSFTTVNAANGPQNDPWQVDNATNASSANWTIPAHTNFAYVNDDECNCTQNNVDLIFPVVDLTGYPQGELVFEHFYQGNTYQGDTETANLLVSINGGAYTQVAGIATNGAWATQTVDISAYMGNASVQFKINYSDGTGWLYGCAIDDVVINGLAPLDVQVAVNTGNGYEANLGPNGSVYFLDPTTGDAMAEITNTSSFDYGCITVEVDRSGETPGAEEFNSPAVADYLHSKTFKVTPTNNNPSGTFDITLYYQEAEVAAWETATGNSRTNAEIIKVAGDNAIADVTPANAGTFTIENVAASNAAAFGGDVGFTASFTTGFSGFGVGIYNPAVGNPPVASFSASSIKVCEGESVDFTDESTENPASWSWDFGGAGTSSQQNPTFTFGTAGSYDVTLTASNGFGSSISTVTTIVVDPISTLNQSVTICPGETFTVGTSDYTSAGTFTDVLVNTNGCDSTVTTTITLLPESSSTNNVTICDGASYTVGSSTYTTSGTYTDILTGANGCDSTVTTNLSVLTAIEVTNDVEICDGDSYTVGTSTYTTAGNYQDVLQAATGCDSIINTNLSVVTSFSVTQDISLCPGETVTVGTSTYNSAGSYSDVLQSSTGCDSTVTTNVTMLTTSSSTQNITLCDGETVTVGTNTYSAAGQYTDVLTNSQGCDSTVTTNVTVLPTYTFQQDVTLCDGESITVGSSTYSSAGSFTDVLTASNGCDSTVYTNISIVSPTTSSQTVEICSGDSYTIGSSTYSTDGVYTDVLVGSNGCDSTVTTTLVVLAPITSSQDVALCPGESVTVGSNTYTTTGQYTDVLTSVNGCDSTVTTTVTELQPTSFTQNINICEGSSVSVGNSTYTTSGNYTDVLTGSNGCDSTVYTNLTVDPLPQVDITPNTIDPICVQNGVTITLIGAPTGGTFSGTGVTGDQFDASVAGVGIHIITYTYTDGNGCTNSVEVTAEVVDCAGIEQNTLTGITLSPNPSHGAISIKGLETGAQYAIYDSRGRIVKQGSVLPESGAELISLELVQSGVYHLRATYNGQIANIKFIVTK